jgi:exopolysaccharide biosynthesis polyprenyl glycosylphosphotransferase
MDFCSSIILLKIVPFIKKWNLINIILGTIDILTIALAFQCSYFINYFHKGGFFFTDKKLFLLFIGILPFWLLILYLIKITEIPRTKRYRVLLFEYFQSAIAIAAIMLIVYFLFKMAWISRMFLIELTFLGFIFLFFVRLSEYKILKTYRAKGHNTINVVLIVDDSSIQFIDRLLYFKEWGFRIIAIFTGSIQIKEKYEKDIVLLSEEYLEVVNDFLEVDIIDEILYIKKKVVPSEIRRVIRSCEELGVVFRLKCDDKVINLTNAIESVIANEKFMTFINIPHNSYSLAIKRIMDIFISITLIISLFPLFLVIAYIIKLTSSGPVIHTQTRVGLRGRQFILYKFRSMVADAEALRKDLEDKNEVDGPVFKIKYDPRITEIGKFLRRTGLDELPQLFNILKGEMSLIGPRPPLPLETQKYKRWQLRRLSVKPGLSCFWQIKPYRNSIKFEEWMEMDLAYIDNWSVRLDFIILFKTLKNIFSSIGV